MKLTEIEVWNSHNGPYIRLRRSYTNPAVEQVVRLYPKEVASYLYKDSAQQPFEPGIRHLTRPL